MLARKEPKGARSVKYQFPQPNSDYAFQIGIELIFEPGSAARSVRVQSELATEELLLPASLHLCQSFNVR